MRYRVVTEELCKLRCEYLIEAGSEEEAAEMARDPKAGGEVVDYEYLTFGYPTIESVKVAEVGPGKVVI